MLQYYNIFIVLWNEYLEVRDSMQEELLVARSTYLQNENMYKKTGSDIGATGVDTATR